MLLYNPSLARSATTRLSSFPTEQILGIPTESTAKHRIFPSRSCCQRRAEPRLMIGRNLLHVRLLEFSLYVGGHPDLRIFLAHYSPLPPATARSPARGMWGTSSKSLLARPAPFGIYICKEHHLVGENLQER